MAYEYGNLKWSEMTDEQRESAGSKSEHKAAKNAYEESQSTPAPTPTPDDSNPLNSKYSEMSDTYKENTSKADHKAAKEKAEQYENTKYSEIEDEEYKALVNRSTHMDNKQSAQEAKQDADPLNTNYSDMSDAYKANTTKADHKQDRKDAGFYTNDRLESYKVDNLDDLDITATGRGRKEGENRLSVTELERMAAAGHSKEEIANKATTGTWSDAKRGSAAQELLNSWTAEFTSNSGTGDTGTDDTGMGDTGIGDTGIGDPGTGDPGTGDPGTGDPGTGDPGTGDPGTGTPGTGDPGTGNPDPGGGNDVIDVVGDDNNVIGDDGIINEDIQNTDIEDSFNGGTIGAITQGGTINGNNNTINNTVDNSNNSRYYGGNNTVWNINNSNESPNTGFALGGGNYTGGVDTLLSDLTTLGYGKPDDSPASNAQFVDMYQTLNSDAQKKYENVGSDTANKYIQMARDNNPVNFEGIQQTLSGYYNDEGQFVPGTSQNFYDRAVARQTQFMGDYANFRPPEYISPDPPASIDDNLDEIAEDAMNF